MGRDPFKHSPERRPRCRSTSPGKYCSPYAFPASNFAMSSPGVREAFPVAMTRKEPRWMAWAQTWSPTVISASSQMLARPRWGGRGWLGPSGRRRRGRRRSAGVFLRHEWPAACAASRAPANQQPGDYLRASCERPAAPRARGGSRRQSVHRARTFPGPTA